VAQYKKGRHYAYVQGKWHYERKQSGYGEQTKPIFQEKLKSLRDVNILNWEDLRR